MQSQTLSPRLSRALHRIINYHTAEFRNEDVRMILTNLIEKEEFGVFLFDIQPQVDNLFDFIRCAAEELKYPSETDEESTCPARHPSFQAVIDWIAVLISPACIYHLSGGATENDVIDLIIVLHENEKKTFNACEGLINVMNADRRIVNFTLFKMQQLNKYVEEGSIFYIKACQPEQLVYHNGEQIRIPSSPDLSLLKARAKEKFETGYNRGILFLEGAQNYMKHNHREMAAFMLQQAAELTLRAVVLSITCVDIRNHSIEVLLKYCNRFAPRLTTVFPRNTPEERHLTGLLEAAYLKARYTGEFVITTPELMLLNEKISRLLDMAATTVRELITAFDPGTRD